MKDKKRKRFKKLVKCGSSTYFADVLRLKLTIKKDKK